MHYTLSQANLTDFCDTQCASDLAVTYNNCGYIESSNPVEVGELLQSINKITINQHNYTYY